MTYYLVLKISLNLYNNKTSLKFLNDMYMHAWKSGLKTTYYLRSTAASTIEKSTVSSGKQQYTKDEAEACSIEAMRNGEECEACQKIATVIYFVYEYRNKKTS